VRRRITFAVRALLAALFRSAVRLARALRLLPQPSGSFSEPRILITHLTPHLGDTIMVMPMIEALRAAQPKARIDFAAESSAVSLLSGLPGLDHVYSLPLGSKPPVSPLQSIGRVLRVTRAYLARRTELTPTLCLSPRWGDDQYRSNVLAFLTGAVRRIGFSSPIASYRDSFLTEPIPGGNGLHEAERFCLLAAEAGLIPHSAIELAAKRPVASLRSLATEQDWPALAHRLGVQLGRPFAVIAPGATMPRRIWPIERWAEVARSLESMGMAVVLLSGPADRHISERLHQSCGQSTVLAAGRTNLLETVALLSNADLFLGSDSGPGHVAGALGVPSVILFITLPQHDPDGVSSPERIGPVGPFVEWCCPAQTLEPCTGACTAADAHCIAQISPSTVLRAAESVLQRAHANSSAAVVS
jgi:ADP-heptose:LPS heptosyltransferase